MPANNPALRFSGGNHIVQKNSFLLFLLSIAIFGELSCVTEAPRRAVVIEGQRIFAPRGFLGRWIRTDRPDQGLAFQLPPGTAISVVSTARAPEAYDIVRTIERPDGIVSFRLKPRGGSGREIERHFRLGPAVDDERNSRPALLYEVFPGEEREIEYRRVK